MSHEVEDIAYAGEKPWHGLGVKVPHDLTPEQILSAANLDWTVEKRPMYYCNASGSVSSTTEIEGRQVLVRSTDGKQLSIVTDNWEPIQNSLAIEVFNDFIQEGDMAMECAGSLREGKIVFVLAKTAEKFRVFGEDLVQGYFLFSNPHEYGQTVRFGGTSIRVVCQNTHSFALRKGLDNEIRFSHRGKLDTSEVKPAMAALRRRLEEFSQIAEFLGTREYRDRQVESYFQELFPPFTGNKKNQTIPSISRNTKQALKLLDTQPGATYAPNTWWNAYNAYSFMTDHVLGRTRDNRMSSAWFGNHRRTKIKALDLAIKYAKAA